MTDPIADMLTRIRNAILARKSEVVVPFSGIKQDLAKILVKEGYLVGVEKINDALATAWSLHTSRRVAKRGRGDILRLTLKYDSTGQSALRHLERVSKPSRRVYVSKNELPVVLSGLGVAIISTSQGLFTNKQAKRLKIGGEVLCEVY
ncbi:30S ribosomal protein S8 [Candidatus Uhrbacteria bacterium RIFCSPLOWO2_12_FULL_46_10]|uniref:Small ribosomal subunit protein uS8 n=1 Tax=Candidatus Uhrbacteria bacterium RIFCSPLOWO2_01_FULL_47_25 TaxID=1802402 RepID=A0A1F7UWZ4_9BACT|nr:MAG: 30S ribosomal protein S8 [Parcubacteria group bacterium GW2011_GWA2_46_9]OGL59130.1 MAG: 30S ribosomal protein S8 [Candidatus Uhrbacteria bacterium RIFCSPHIGHO2_01_FULL_46_23]OGL70258.1 MAG: 30S ribosomal protein S8 [Candidatus Uhrbacteria bacterium RIFCSPHIGHO2_02_FULL_47_29]OGL74678.1 MAG: 30S ribosomal protein S8 [Candidatus Uhrbacteria bacterium RIFCSPHIGHO2_12_FULL_46_13]OGL82795.1 MAG: 30S ribosomal protein S8 [Candidatus Uhrbacteria bacterium RIFCSPLOWO2_01_FULL_47_25]OGL83889.1